MRSLTARLPPRLLTCGLFLAPSTHPPSPTSQPTGWGGEISIAKGTLDGRCEKCPANFYQPLFPSAAAAANVSADAASVTTACLPCPPFSVTPAGQTGLTSRDACQCVEGYYAAPDGTSCLPAPAGSFTSVKGANAPTKCPRNTIAPAEALKSCEICPDNAVSVEGNTACACREGYGGALTGAQGSCAPCGQNRYQARLQAVSACTACPKGSATLPGVTTAAAVTDCKCMPGNLQRDGQCDLVPAGSYTDAPGLTAPFPCPPSTISPEPGATACAACPLNAASAGSGTFCACQAGFSGVLQGASGQCRCAAPPPRHPCALFPPTRRVDGPRRVA